MGLFLFIFVLFKLTHIDFTEIQTWIVRVDGKQVDHLTTTTAPNQIISNMIGKAKIKFFLIRIIYCPWSSGYG